MQSIAEAADGLFYISLRLLGILHLSGQQACFALFNSLLQFFSLQRPKRFHRLPLELWLRLTAGGANRPNDIFGLLEHLL